MTELKAFHDSEGDVTAEFVLTASAAAMIEVFKGANTAKLTSDKSVEIYYPGGPYPLEPGSYSLSVGSYASPSQPCYVVLKY